MHYLFVDYQLFVGKQTGALSTGGAPQRHWPQKPWRCHKKEPQADYALGVPELLPQLRLMGPGGGVSGDGEPPGRA
jgi:hypothetical protein